MTDEEFAPVIFYECPFCHTKQDLHKVKISSRVGKLKQKRCIFCKREFIIRQFIAVEEL